MAQDEKQTDSEMDTSIEALMPILEEMKRQGEERGKLLEDILLSVQTKRELKREVEELRTKLTIATNRLIRFRLFLEYLDRYKATASRWRDEKSSKEWLDAIEEELGEARGILTGTHLDSFSHELMQIATIAFHAWEGAKSETGSIDGS